MNQETRALVGPAIASGAVFALVGPAIASGAVFALGIVLLFAHVTFFGIVALFLASGVIGHASRKLARLQPRSRQ